MPPTLVLDEIRKRATAKTFPDHSGYSGISATGIAELAGMSNVSRREVEIAALENEIVPERYVRNMKMFSPAEQAALLKSSACVVGLGGLGGTVTEILTRLGIGRLTLIDGDSFEESNLNRQLLSSEALLKTPKAEAARQRVQAVNSSVEVCMHAEFLNAENAAGLIDACDLVIDCLDSIATRFVLESAARQNGCPMVSAAIAGTAAQITTIFPEDTGLRLIYGHPDHISVRGAEESLGTLPHCVMLAASLECSEAVKILLKRGSLLRNKMLITDLMSNMHDIIQLI